MKVQVTLKNTKETFRKSKGVFWTLLTCGTLKGRFMMKLLEKFKEQKDIRLVKSDNLLEEVLPYLNSQEIKPEDIVTLLFIENNVVELNVLGAVIWDKLKKECSLEKIAFDLKDAFNAPFDQIKEDLDYFINILEENKIIVSREEK